MAFGDSPSRQKERQAVPEPSGRRPAAAGGACLEDNCTSEATGLGPASTVALGSATARPPREAAGRGIPRRSATGSRVQACDQPAAAQRRSARTCWPRGGKAPPAFQACALPSSHTASTMMMMMMMMMMTGLLIPKFVGIIPTSSFLYLFFFNSE